MVVKDTPNVILGLDRLNTNHLKHREPPPHSERDTAVPNFPR